MTKKLSTPFAADSTLRNDVPVNATSDQTSKGIVGYNNGWTSINKLPLENGGQPPFMEDINGVLFDITGNIVDINKGLPQYYDDSYATLVGGYPVGARLCLNDNSGFVVSTIANNQNNPNTNLTNWRKISEKENISSVASIADMLKLDVWNGRAVNVLSYTAGLNVGGGEFTYDASQASTNNGITIFNGWLRDLSNKKLSTDDAGLVDSTNNNAVLMQSIADLLQDNFTLEINCKVLANTQIVIQGKNGIKVHFASNGLLSAKEFRSSFVHWGGAGNRGILTFIDCMYPQVYDPKIIGAKSINLSVSETRAEGDSLIHFKRCMHYSVFGGDCSHAYTWGIQGEQSSYGIVNKVKVSDVCVQGGISLSLSGGSNNTVTNCDVSNCGLVGIEWESANDAILSVGNVSTGNYVYDCMKGQTIITNIHGVTSSNNRFVRCAFGLVSATNISIKDKLELLSFSNNTIVDCPEAITAYNSAKLSVAGNQIYSPVVNQYTIKNPYNVLLDISGTRTFRVNGGTTTDSNDTGATYSVGDSIKIGSISTVYKVTQVDRVTDDTYKMGHLQVITVDSDLDSSIEPCTNVRTLNNTKHGITTRFANSSIKFTSNSLYGFDNAIVSYLEATSDETYTKNFISNCASILYTPTGTATGLNYFDNTVLGGGTFDLNSSSYANANILFQKVNYVEVFNTSRPTTGTAIPTLNFNAPEDTYVRGFRVRFPFADYSTTGSLLVVKIDGNDTVALGVAGVDKTSTEFKYFGKIGAGNHTVQIIDSNGDLTYKQCIVEMIVIN